MVWIFPQPLKHVSTTHLHMKPCSYIKKTLPAPKWVLHCVYQRPVEGLFIATGRSNQSILKEISPEHSLEGLMLKLKRQYFGHLMQRADSFETTLMLGKIESRRRGLQRMRWLDGLTNSMDMSLSKLWAGVGDGQGGLACCSPWGHKELDMTEQLNWIELWRVYL